MSEENQMYFSKPKILIDLEEYDHLKLKIDDLHDEVWLLQMRINELEKLNNGKV